MSFNLGWEVMCKICLRHQKGKLDNSFCGFQCFCCFKYVKLFLSYSLESVSTTCKQLSQELMEKYEELKKMEVHNNEYRAEIKKVKICVLGIAKFVFMD